jgi:phosphoribosylglycinamide formyltransferase 1
LKPVDFKIIFYLKQIAIFASGAGTNTREIINYFRNSVTIRVCIILCNNSKAGVIDTAKKENIPHILIEKNKFFYTDYYLQELLRFQTDLIVLAGFLWKIPDNIIRAFEGRIINIHPALLPRFGGKGMYGLAVHREVLKSGEKESGITIHYVNEKYDEGEIILQKKCSVDPNDTPETLANKIHQLEYKWLPNVIESLLTENLNN